MAQSLSQTLNSAQLGQSVIIQAIDNPEAQSQVIRLGLMVGDSVVLVNRVLGGPTIIQKGYLEVAFGQELATQIQVKPE